ncbi:MAG: class I SAM-dependent methyltransferase [Vicinamibacterales bacterium]
MYRLSARTVSLAPPHNFELRDVADLRRRRLIGMLTLNEQAYLRWYAKRRYTGRGEIVDLGCWLGSSTMPLALGLRDNRAVPVHRQVIHAYDIFRWEDWMDESVKGTSLEGRYRAGDSFLDEFQRRTAPWSTMVRPYAADLRAIGWTGGDIEFLFIDAMKSWDLTNSILKTFFPALIPGFSVIVHQDFAHYYTPWIHLVMYRLRRFFSPICHIAESGSVVFRYQERIPDSILNAAYSFASFTDHEIEAAFEHSVTLVAGRKRSNVMAAKVMIAVHQGNKQLATRWLNTMRDHNYQKDKELLRVQDCVAGLSPEGSGAVSQ